MGSKALDRKHKNQERDRDWSDRVDGRWFGDRDSSNRAKKE